MVVKIRGIFKNRVLLILTVKKLTYFKVLVYYGKCSFKIKYVILGWFWDICNLGKIYLCVGQLISNVWIVFSPRENLSQIKQH